MEIVVRILIENKNGEILLTKSPRWGNVWIMPGGHVELGEKLVDTVVREGREETGLNLKPIDFMSWGEFIGSIGPKDHPWLAHVIYFDVYCKVIKGKIKLQKKELSEYKWVKPQEALRMNLAKSWSTSLNDFIAYKQQRR